MFYTYKFWPPVFSAKLKAALDKPTEQQRIDAIDRVTDAMASAGFVRRRTECRIAPTWQGAQDQIKGQA